MASIAKITLIKIASKKSQTPFNQVRVNFVWHQQYEYSIYETLKNPTQKTKHHRYFHTNIIIYWGINLPPVQHGWKNAETEKSIPLTHFMTFSLHQGKPLFCLPSLKLTFSHLKWMVGILSHFFWGLAYFQVRLLLVSGSVWDIFTTLVTSHHCRISPSSSPSRKNARRGTSVVSSSPRPTKMQHMG